MAGAPLRDDRPGIVAVPTRHDDHGRPRGNHPMQTQHQTRNVEHRHHHQTDTLRRVVRPQPHGVGVVHHRALRVHTPLG